MISQANAQLSDRILKMAESATLKMSQLARELEADGHDVISLSIGEPDFDTPVHIKEAAIQALQDGFTKYTPVPGLPVLRNAISNKFKRDNNLDYTPDQIVVSNGAKQSIANLCLALLNEGDEVILFAPFWVSYIEIVKMAGGVPVQLKADIEKDFKVDAAQLKEAITDKTKMIIFSSPCNPTGSVYLHEELETIAKVVDQHPQITIVSDEIYEYINFTPKHASIGTFKEVKDQTVTVNGMSKGFAMTGWRLGYMGAPKWIAKACAKIQGQFTSGATAFGQVAAAHALNSDLQHTHEMCDTFQRRRDMVIEKLKEIPGFKVNHPLGAFYSFPDISAYFGKSYEQYTINNSDDFAMYILQKAHVAIVAGSAFGDNDCIRISYAAADDQLLEAIKRIKEAVSLLA